ncbi:hypothetical protein HYQ46_010855 [Verticillium longisporum]|nr:hypothetical protein HYQ46_010855 [Verticillium longisporum]
MLRLPGPNAPLSLQAGFLSRDVVSAHGQHCYIDKVFFWLSVFHRQTPDDRERELKWTSVMAARKAT